MNRITLNALIAAALLCLGYPLGAQTNEESDVEPGELESISLRAGLYGAGARHLHETTANVFAGGAECGAFGDGEGDGFAFGGFIELPLIKLVDLYASLGYTQRGGDLGEAYVGGLPIQDPNTEEYTFLERRHSYGTELSYLRTEFGVRVTLPWFPLYLRSTASLDFPQSTTFLQEEEIISPEGVLYPETNRTVREVASGDLQDPEALMALSGAIGYELPLGRQLSIAPEISYYHPFTDVVLNRDWQIRSIQAGAALRWSFGPIKRLEPPLPPVVAIAPPPAPPSPEPVPPTAKVSITSPESLSIVRTVVTETFPILPYIFFDSGTSRLPVRYRMLSRAQTGSFDEDAISWESLEAYHDLLNVLGKRMNEDPSITITLTGTTDGSEVGGSTLGAERAETIREYLQSVWGVDRDRITVKSMASPRFPSSELYPEGKTENRRVEITSSNGKGLEPIVHRRFNEYSYSPDEITLALGSVASDPISSWDLRMVADDEEVYRLAGEGPPPASMKIGINQERAGKISDGLGNGGDLSVRLGVRSAGLASAVEEREIPTRIDLNPFEISRLSLIVFDFDRSEIVGTNRTMVTEFVSEALGDESTVTIVGSTDRLGDPEHNRTLSQSRAESVRKIVEAEAPEATITEVTGVGQRLRYNNDLPEGRYYCRTVTVEVTTPLDTRE